MRRVSRWRMCPPSMTRTTETAISASPVSSDRLNGSFPAANADAATSRKLTPFAVPLVQMDPVTCASPDYLHAHGVPRTFA